MKRVFALYLLVCATNAQSNEPEPEMYSTTMDSEPSPESAMSSTSVAASSAAPTSAVATSTYDAATSATSAVTATSTGAPMVSTTTAAPQPTHRITMGIEISNFSAFTNTAEFTNALKAAATKGITDPDAKVTVVLKKVHINTTYEGMPDPLPTTTRDDIAVATFNMYSKAVPMTGITVNGDLHSDPASVTRRLQSGNTGTAQVVATVDNDGSGSDVITKVKNLQSQTSATNLHNALKTINSATYDSYSITGGTPKLQVVAETIVTGTNTAPSTSALVANVGADIGGTVQITSVTSTNVVTTTVSDPGLDDHAPIAPMMTIWVALYAFVMS